MTQDPDGGNALLPAVVPIPCMTRKGRTVSTVVCVLYFVTFPAFERSIEAVSTHNTGCSLAGGVRCKFVVCRSVAKASRSEIRIKCPIGHGKF